MKFDDTARIFGPTKGSTGETIEKLASYGVYVVDGRISYSPPVEQTDDNLSPAKKRLNERVADARKRFRFERDRAWGDREVSSRTPEDYLKREERLWDKFQAELKRLHKIHEQEERSGKVIRLRNRWRKCSVCGQNDIPKGRKKCDSCIKAARRRRNHKYYASSSH